MSGEPKSSDDGCGCVLWFLVLVLIFSTCNDVNRNDLRTLERRVDSLQVRIDSLEARP